MLETLPQNSETNPTNPLPIRKKSGAKKILAVILIVAAFFVGLGVGRQQLTVSNGKLEINKGGNRSADYNLLWDALDLLNQKYVDRGHLDQKSLLYGAISGMLKATGDPYTVFFDPIQSDEFAEELKGSFEGIGAQIDTKDGQIIIVAPLEGSPAERAGLLPGDAILAIDSESTVDMSVDVAVSKIRGKAGTKVILTVLHSDQSETKDLTITREKIEINSVKMETKEIEGKKIAVVKVARFGDDTVGLFSHDVDVILAGNYDGVIVDLRNNPGGYLDGAVDLASNWVANGQTVVKEVNYDGNTKPYLAKGLSRLSGIKTVLLINGGSASASEILAGALQDYGAATLVGEKTFGKGSVQELSPMNGGSAVKITVAKWLTPKDRSIDKNGLEPDIVVERTVDDIKAGHDPQLDRALEQFK